MVKMDPSRANIRSGLCARLSGELFEVCGIFLALLVFFGTAKRNIHIGMLAKREDCFV